LNDPQPVSLALQNWHDGSWWGLTRAVAPSCSVPVNSCYLRITSPWSHNAGAPGNSTAPKATYQVVLS